MGLSGTRRRLEEWGVLNKLSIKVLYHGFCGDKESIWIWLLILKGGLGYGIAMADSLQGEEQKKK